jgi:hypothetical protein
VILAALLVACRGARSDALQGVSPSAAPEPAIPAFEAGGGLPSRLTHDRVWQRAAGGDPTDLSSLGRDQGAAMLFGWILQGKRAGLIALEALPFAEDAAEYNGPLCDLLIRVEARDRAPVLRALLRMVAVQAPPADAAAGCVRVLSERLGVAQSELEFDLRASLLQGLVGLEAVPARSL